MARLKSCAPTLRYHLSGQAVVTIDGRDFYLGKHGSPEAFARYAVLIGDYQANGLHLPDGFDQRANDKRASLLLSQKADIPAEHLEDRPITVKELTAAYRAHVDERYGQSHQVQDRERRKAICNVLDDYDAKTPVDEFGPRKLKEHRARFVADGNKSRKYINVLIGEIRRVFRWGIAEELVKAETLVRLKAVDPLRGGEAAFENDDREAVDIDVVRKTAPFLSPIVRAMLRVQIKTGMRPSEICRMRPCDIDRSGPIWLYKPSSHKTKWKGQKREIPLLGDAREAVEDFMNRDPKAFLFSPAESMAWLRAKLRSERTGYGSYKKLKADPKKSPGLCYTSHSYRQSIQRAAKEAKVTQWTPYQIRHLVGTMVGELLDLENAKALLGHADIATTQIYSRSTREQSIKAAKVAPSLSENR